MCGVNRITTSGRVAAPEQKVSQEGGLRAITIEAAYSLRMEEYIGSIEVGKLANFTILAENPIKISPENIKDIEVWGTVLEGKKQPVVNKESTRIGYQNIDNDSDNTIIYSGALKHIKRIVTGHSHNH